MRGFPLRMLVLALALVTAANLAPSAAAQAGTVCGLADHPCQTSLEARLRGVEDPLPPAPFPGHAMLGFTYSFDATYVALAGHSTEVQVRISAEDDTVAVDPSLQTFILRMPGPGAMGTYDVAFQQELRLRCQPGFEGLGRVEVQAFAEANGIYEASRAMTSFHVACMDQPVGVEEAPAMVADQGPDGEEGTYTTAGAGALGALPFAPLAVGVGLAGVAVAVPRMRALLGRLR